MTMASDGQGLAALWFDGTREEARFADRKPTTKALPVFDETRRWLDLYFASEKPDFIPQLAPKGTAFQQRVWDILLTKTFNYLIVPLNLPVEFFNKVFNFFCHIIQVFCILLQCTLNEAFQSTI